MKFYTKIILSSIEHNSNDWTIIHFKDGFSIYDKKFLLEINIPNNIFYNVYMYFYNKNNFYYKNNFNYEMVGFFESLYLRYKINKILKKE